jgi:8-oxo-dGTP diphosphatase
MAESLPRDIVASCILEKDGKYLLVQEKKAIAYGLWSLPGGRVDKGELIETAAVREAFEETGFRVTITSKLPLEHSDINTSVFHIFQTKVTSGELSIPKDELLDAQWLTLEEIQMLQADHKLRNEWIVRSIVKVIAT